MKATKLMLLDRIVMIPPGHTAMSFFYFYLMISPSALASVLIAN
jgi:hypothetical protein